MPGEDDFPRTRLTHSLEVAQIGREIGAALGCDPDITDAAGLAHDIGHPPFGHNGETALDAAAAGCGGFEGNAQTLRVLTRLEPKVLDAGGRLGRAEPHPRDARRRLQVPVAAPGRHPEVRLLRRRPGRLRLAAGRRAGGPALPRGAGHGLGRRRRLLGARRRGRRARRAGAAGFGGRRRARACCARWRPSCTPPRPPQSLAPVLDELLALPTLRDLADYDGSYRAQAAAKRATSELLGRFAGAALAATRAAYGPGPLSRYAADLVVPDRTAAECALLKAVAAHYVMARPGAVERQAGQRRLLERAGRGAARRRAGRARPRAGRRVARRRRTTPAGCVSSSTRSPSSPTRPRSPGTPGSPAAPPAGAGRVVGPGAPQLSRLR